VWKPSPWRAVSNAVAIRNARTASLLLARRRREREEVEAFLDDIAKKLQHPLGV
jgi:hypothetical protein